MFLDKVQDSKKNEFVFVTIFGVDGVGKSTFGADAPSPIFIQTESGANYLKVKCLPKPKAFSDILGMVDELLEKEHGYKTLVLDSLDWAEQLVWDEVCFENNKVKSIGDIPYGKGYELAVGKWQTLMSKMKHLREKMNIILIAHSQVKTFQDPVQASGYDRYEMKLHAKSAAKIREAVDAVLFATYEVFLKKDGQRTRAFGDGARVLMTQHRPGHDGKNRMGLPYQIDLSWSEFMKAVKNGQPNAPDNIKQDIDEMLLSVHDENLKTLVTKAVVEAGSDATQLGKIQNRLRVKLEV